MRVGLPVMPYQKTKTVAPSIPIGTMWLFSPAIRKTIILVFLGQMRPRPTFFQQVIPIKIVLSKTIPLSGFPPA